MRSYPGVSVGVIASVKPLLQALDEADFRIADALRQNALRLAGEA